MLFSAYVYQDPSSSMACPVYHINIELFYPSNVYKIRVAVNVLRIKLSNIIWNNISHESNIIEKRSKVIYISFYRDTKNVLEQ